MPLTNYRLPDCASSSFISAANFAAAARSGDFLAYLRARAWLKPFRTADNAFSLSYSHASFCGITRANRSTMSWPCCSTIIVRFAKASPSVIRPLESVCLVTVLIWIMNTVFTTIPQMSSGKVGIYAYCAIHRACARGHFFNQAAIKIIPPRKNQKPKSCMSTMPLKFELTVYSAAGARTQS